MTRLLKLSPRRYSFAFVLALVVALNASASGPADAQRYLSDVKALTTPSMEGRGDGTQGLTRAAQLIEHRFKSLGLEPAGSNSYRQPFTLVTGARLKGDNQFQLDERELELNQEFVPFSFSASGAASAPVVFVGYGASAGEFGYDDYDGIDVKDKI